METAQTTKKINLYFYLKDNSLELYDISHRRTILKRTVTEISLADIFIGAQLFIYGKSILIKSYGNQITEIKMNKFKQRQ
jgi:hypothetical protein